MKVALGQQVGGYFANDDALAEVIGDAGEASGEPLWRFPLAADYEEKLSSPVADADNAPGGPGAITAALFLQHFVGDGPVGPPRHRLGRRRPRGELTSGPRAPPASAPAPCSPGSATPHP